MMFAQYSIFRENSRASSTSAATDTDRPRLPPLKLHGLKKDENEADDEGDIGLSDEEDDDDEVAQLRRTPSRPKKQYRLLRSPRLPTLTFTGQITKDTMPGAHLSRRPIFSRGSTRESPLSRVQSAMRPPSGSQSRERSYLSPTPPRGILKNSAHPLIPQSQKAGEPTANGEVERYSGTTGPLCCQMDMEIQGYGDERIRTASAKKIRLPSALQNYRDRLEESRSTLESAANKQCVHSELKTWPYWGSLRHSSPTTEHNTLPSWETIDDERRMIELSARRLTQPDDISYWDMDAVFLRHRRAPSKLSHSIPALSIMFR